VNFFEDDEGGRVPPAPAASARKQRSGKVRNKRTLRIQRLAIIVVALFVVVLLLTLWIRSCQHNQKVSGYKDYLSGVQSLITDSNKVGQDLGAIVNNPRKYTRPGLLTKLQSMVNAQNDVATRSQLLKPPGKLVGQNQTFVLGMQVRAKGMQQLRQGILAAIDGKSKVTANDLAALSGYFTGPDAYYTEQFYTQAQNVLKADGVAGVTVPASTFFLKSSMFGPLKLQKMLKNIPGSAVGGVHGVSVVSITVKSGGNTVALVAGRNTRVKASADMIFVVTVSNAGTATESGVPVTLTLQPPGGAQAQKISHTIDGIAPGKTVAVQFNGFNIKPASLSRVSQLTAKAGPVPNEKNLTNNTLQLKIVLTL
jgi:hypothetical protein